MTGLQAYTFGGLAICLLGVIGVNYPLLKSEAWQQVLVD